MRRIAIVVALMAAVLSASPVSAMPPQNVALGAAVTLHGDAFFTAGWGGGQVVPASTVVDGTFLPASTQWDQGTVWWDQNDGRQGEIIIRLNGHCRITALTIQADDNDAYAIRYYDNGGWKKAWDVPNYDAVGFGMQTRPDPTDNTVTHVLQGPIHTSALLVKARPNASNDLFFAVSEVQAFGHCRP